MQFLELMPKYMCTRTPDGFIDNKDVFECIPFAKADSKLPPFCNDTTILEHRINYTNPLSLHNWIVDLKPDLTCIEQGFTSPIGLLGSMQFVGWALSAFITPRLSDIYGRKLIFLGSMLLQLAALIGIYISRSVKLTTALIFFFGMGGVGRSSISYLYM